MARVAVLPLPHHDGLLYFLLFVFWLVGPVVRARVAKSWLPPALNDKPNVELKVPVAWLNVDQPVVCAAAA